MGFELYRSDENRHIFLIDGEIRALPDDIITQLTWSLLPRCVKVNSPAALPFKTGERLPVFVDGQLTVWERFETAAECYLTPVGQMPLIRDVQYGLYEDDAGYYIIQPISKGS
jgi:hypothetical protein